MSNRHPDFPIPDLASDFQIEDNIGKVLGMLGIPINDQGGGALFRNPNGTTWNLIDQFPASLIPEFVGDVVGALDNNFVQSITQANFTTIDGTTVTTPYTVTGKDFVVFSDDPGASTTADLPPAINGKQVLVMKASSNVTDLTVQPFSGDTIDNSGPITMSPLDWVVLVSDGVSNWNIIAESADLQGALSKTLTSAHIFVGNASNIATDRAMSGDASINNTGVLTLANSGVTANTYGDAQHVPQVTFDAKGRATAASNKLSNPSINCQFNDAFNGGL